MATTKFDAKMKFIQNLRLAELEAKKEVRHYKLLYRQECKTTHLLRKQLKSLTSKMLNLETKYHNLHNKVSISSNVTQSRKRKQKPWLQVRCNRTKHKRLNDYGNAVFNTIQSNIPQCKRAQLSLSLGNKTLNYSWQKNQLQSDNGCALETNILNFSKKSDHSYACPKFIQCQSEDDEMYDIDYGKIFDSQGNWQAEHKRGIINVMDSYRDIT